jgi:hypothetical protein
MTGGASEMQATSDLILIVEEDPKSVAMLKGVADHLGSDFVEAESTDALHQILSIRRRYSSAPSTSGCSRAHDVRAPPRGSP